MFQVVLFLVVGAALLAAVMVAILAGVDLYYLSGSRAIADDGMMRGAAGPAWSLPDGAGRLIQSPPDGKPLQAIVFADHSLRSFPSVVEGLRTLAAAPDTEMVVLTRQPSKLAGPVLEILGLGGVPVAAGSSRLYGRYNVRVMPFLIFVGSDGRVRASSLVNHAWQVEKLWRLAQIPPEPEELRAPQPGRQRTRVAM